MRLVSICFTIHSVVWLQYVLLPVAWFAFAKGMIVFGGSAALAWAMAVAARSVPFGPLLVGTERRLCWRVPATPRPDPRLCRASMRARIGRSGNRELSTRSDQACDVADFSPASRNLLQDRLRFVATVIGVVFSIVLVTVQMGLFLSFERMVTIMIDHAPADLWIVPLGTKCFEDPTLLDEHDRARALSVAGVTAAVPLLIGFTQWAVPTGGTTPVLVIGSNGGAEDLRPWNVIAGHIDELSDPHAVAIDQTYFSIGLVWRGLATRLRFMINRRGRWPSPAAYDHLRRRPICSPR